MHFNPLRQFLLVLFCALSYVANTQVDYTQIDKHVKVALRMVGHQILLEAGDSTSRVLPVTNEGNQFKVQFSSPFEFEPAKLAETVNRVVRDAKIAENYIVEMITCDSSKVVYSYEVGRKLNSDIIPCSARIQPKACYALVFTLLQEYPPIQSEATRVVDQKRDTSTVIIGLLLGLVVLIVVFVFLVKRKKEELPNPNLIQMGAFQFDKLNMILLLKEQKIELTSKEADLLLLLYKDVNTTIEKEVLLSKVWGDDGDYVGRTLDVFISKLRKKLEFDPKVKIVNIRGVGYKMVVEEN